MQAEQIDLPDEQAPLNPQIRVLDKAIKQHSTFADQLNNWTASIGSYAFYWNEYFSKPHDPSLVMGQDNLQCYKPHSHIVLRGQKEDYPLDLLRIIAAALTCEANLEVSLEEEAVVSLFKELGSLISCLSNKKTMKHLLNVYPKGKSNVCAFFATHLLMCKLLLPNLPAV